MECFSSRNVVFPSKTSIGSCSSVQRWRSTVQCSDRVCSLSFRLSIDLFRLVMQNKFFSIIIFNQLNHRHSMNFIWCKINPIVYSPNERNVGIHRVGSNRSPSKRIVRGLFFVWSIFIWLNDVFFQIVTEFYSLLCIRQRNGDWWLCHWNSSFSFDWDSWSNFTKEQNVTSSSII